MKSLLFIFMLFLINACATQAKYQKNVESWLGSDESALVSSWGPPSDVYKMDDGSKILTYNYIGGSRSIANYNAYTDQVYMNTYASSCKTSFTINDSSMITNWRFEGNACRSK